MPSRNFDFLAREFPEIHKTLCKAEREVLDDPPTSLSLMRIGAELMLRMMGESALPFEDLKNLKFADLLRYLSARRHIVPGHIADDLQQVWVSGSPAVHLGRGDHSVAAAMCQRCHRIAVWLHEKFAKDSSSRPGEYCPVARAASVRADSSFSAGMQGPASECWIMRPYPHRIYRLKEFIAGSIIAIGWPFIGDIANLSREEILHRLEDKYRNKDRRWHTDSRATILRFRDQVKIGDIVVLASNANDTRAVALAAVGGPYAFNPTLAADDDGYAHQKAVRFLSHPTHGLMVDRRHLPEETVGSMTQGTLHRTESGPLLTWLRQQRME